jgi:myosin-5
LDKNKDALNPDLLGIVSDSDSWLLSNIGASLSEVASADGAANPGGNLGGGSGANATVSGRFGRQLRELLATLDATGLHFVRCVKPNAALAAGAFCPELVLGQLRCCGVLEVARVSRAGFPTRYPHAVFVERYRLMLTRDQQAALAAAPGARGGAGAGGGGGGAVAAVAAVLRAFGVKEGQFAIGHTKVFFRPGGWATVGGSDGSSGV